MSNPGNPNRAYVSSRFQLEVDGHTNVGFLKSVDGGGIKADIVTWNIGATTDQWRYSTKPKYEDITVQLGLGMSRTMYEWISKFFTREIVRKDGAIVSADFNFKEQSRRDFKQAIITEMTFPALDGADKNPGYLTIKLSPEKISYATATGGKVLDKGNQRIEQKTWKPSNFEVSIGKGELKCGRITKVESFTIKQTMLDNKTGASREFQRVPGRIEWPNITVYVPEVDVQGWIDWHDDEVIKGKGKETQKQGWISLKAPDLQKELLHINLSNVGIASISAEKAEAGAEQLRKWKIELHVDQMSCEYK